MEEVINELLKEGDRIVVYFTNSAPYKGEFIKCTHGILVASNKQGRITLMRVSDISRVIKNPEREMAFSDTSDRTEESLTDTELDTEDAIESESRTESRDPNLYEVDLPELAAPKVLGRVDLNKVDPRRADRMRRMQAAKTYVDDSTVDDNGIKIAPMGVITAIGPKFGFIDDNGETRYFNIGEVMKGWSNETPLEKGDEVVFSPADNAHGKVAKCVHRPWSISRQIRTAEQMVYRDQRNAKLLATQLHEAFPDDEDVNDLLFRLHMS